MANQASDGKAPGNPGYQIGELDLGAQPKRTASQELAAVTANPAPARQTGSGLQPVHTALSAGVGASGPTEEQAARLRAAHAAQAQAAQAAQVQAAQRPAAQPQATQAQAAQLQAAQLQAAQAAQLQAAQAAQLQAAQAAQRQAAQQQALQQQAAQAMRAAQQAPAPNAAKPAAAKVAGGGQLAAFDEDGAHAPALELDLARVPTKGGKQAPAPANDVSPQSGYGEHQSGAGGFGDEETGPALELAEVGARVDSVKGGSRDVKAAVNKEGERLATLAGFDPTPTSLIDSVKYAIHVARRLMVLRKEREKAVREAEGLEADLNTALVEVGTGLMTRQTQPELAPLRSRVAAVLDAQSRVSDADLTMSKTREENQQAVAALDREAAEMRSNLQPFLSAEQAAVQAHKQAEDEVKRATAMQRRVEIELRALSDATAVQDPARAEDLRSQLDERRSVVAGLTVEMEQKASLLGQARRELALKKGVLDSIEDRKKRLIDEQQKKEADVEQKAKAAEGGHAAALRALAETAREQGLAQSTVPDKLAWVEEVEGVLADAHKVVDRYDRALTLYDRPSVVRGWVVMGSGVLVLVLLCVLLALQ